nr:prolyl oligopeptidase family serine peptidase [uncultured Roseateles sp.]
MTQPLRSLLGQPLLVSLLSLLLPLAAQAQDAKEASVLKPNANLVAQGIPDIPTQLVEQVARYTDFRGHSFVDWHPLKREMLVSHRKAGANTVQLYLLRSPMAEPEQLTDSADPVRQASFEPLSGHYLVFERSSGGNEANQLYRLDLATKEVTLLTDPAERHDLQGWLHKSSRMLTASVPLDKTAQGGSRASVDTVIRLMDPLDPKATRTLATLPGGGWGVGAASRDDKQVALTRYLSASESEIWLLDLASGKTRQVLPAPGAAAAKASHFVSSFTADNKGLYLVSDRAGEFQELMLYDLATARLKRITRHIPWDVNGASLSHDGRVLAAQLNVDGRNELRLFDGKTLKELPAPALAGGSVSSAQFHPKAKELALATSGSKGPGQLYTLNTASGKVEQWTQAYAPPGLDMSSFPEQQIVRWKSFDGQIISGLLSTPPARFTGRRPVMVLIHGGPEGQATVGFLNRYNYYVNELGIALLQPNVRGSSGYGKTFLSLDDGYKREDSVKDIGTLFDWIATQPNLDASRVLVTGGSYGGYMSLAVSTHYADRIAGAIDVVGISNFVSFLQNTESYRRDLRRVEYGDERDPAMRAFQEKISPLNNAGKITKPLFVVQGKNDPRVPFTEAEQIVAKARENKTPVWYLRAENEGHGFARKENADFQFYATILFLQQTLLK